MCRSDVDPRAESTLAAILDEMAHALAASVGARREDVRIGPVDFGPEPKEKAF